MKIALVGNPNSGKTTLFNLLTGGNQTVGNWPGVTVEKKSGRLRNDKKVEIVDLPGIYSLSPYSPEEIVSRDYLTKENPDVILNIVDGTNLERNLYLTTQLLELGTPVIIALNMIDLVRKNGTMIDLEILSNKLGCDIIPISALENLGTEAIINKLATVNCQPSTVNHNYSGCVEHTLAHIEEFLLHNLPEEKQRYYAIKIFERDEKVIADLKLNKKKLEHVENDITLCEQELCDTSDSIIIAERYNYIENVVADCYKPKKGTLSDRVDGIMTNRFLALPIFACIMFLVYYISISTIGGIATDWANEGLFGEGWSFFGIDVPGIPILVQDFLATIGCAEWLIALIVDGIIAGVGAVLGFVPQLFILFILLSFLEECGYIARIAFILDKIFRRFGLSGKSFIPILIGTGCGVPGIMASRTIENERDRKITIMTTTFIPCSAKLPIIALIAGAVFGGAWWIAPLSYFIGIGAILISGIILKKWKSLKSQNSPFIMELPNYHLPKLTNVLYSAYERSLSFVKKAGTIILLATVFVWFSSNLSWNFEFVEMEDSILASIGNAISWLFAPLGFGDWKSTVAVITGLIAKENIVGTFGILFGDGILPFTTISALSFLVFNLLCAPCFAAMGAIRREMNSWKWFFIAIGYQCGFAYVVALILYQIGRLVI